MLSERKVTQQEPSLSSVFHQISSGGFPPVVENFPRGQTIFFPGEQAARVYFLRTGVVKLSRLYATGEEITVALLPENSVFGVLSFMNAQKAERFYHAVAFTPVELLWVSIKQVELALQDNPKLSALMWQGLSYRILQTEMMIETLVHREMSSRLLSFLLILCCDFGVPTPEGIRIELKLSHQELAEAIGSSRVTVTRLLGDLRAQNRLSIHQKKITVYNPVALSHQLNYSLRQNDTGI